jgi:predicted DNA-binding transcriptional regulator AlpA
MTFVRLDQTQPIAPLVSRASLLSVKQAAKFLGLSKSWLDKARLTGSGPYYVKLGRRVLYDPGDIQAFLSARKHAHTSENN